MKLRMLATNWTNSAAIAESGDIYVWGSRRFGLIYDEKSQSDNSTFSPTPQKLLLGKEGKRQKQDQESESIDSYEEEYKGETKAMDNDNHEVENKLEKENLHLDNYAAQTICMGTYHAVSLLGERGVNIEFTPIQSCRSLLDRIREAISIDYKSTLETLYERQYSKEDIIWSEDKKHYDEYFMAKFFPNSFNDEHEFREILNN